MSDDLKSFCMPDFGNCGPAVGDLVENAKEAIEFFLALKWLETEWKGEKDYHQNPVFLFWYNIPLFVGLCCVPCCTYAVQSRDMQKVTGKSCESECLSCCCLCCLYPCYYGKKRTEFREKHALRGSPCFDCLGFCCCSSCFICQDANQLQANGELAYSVPYCHEKPKQLIKAAEAEGVAAKVPVVETVAAAEVVQPPPPQTME